MPSLSVPGANVVPDTSQSSISYFPDDRTWHLSSLHLIKSQLSLFSCYSWKTEVLFFSTHLGEDFPNYFSPFSYRLVQLDGLLVKASLLLSLFEIMIAGTLLDSVPFAFWSCGTDSFPEVTFFLQKAASSPRPRWDFLMLRPPRAP